ncbi:MAG TPA: phosphoribosyltransferase family protein [bacterium]|nr:phosphoribosyltransferase family protein [bacterium]
MNGCLVCKSAVKGDELFCKECSKFALVSVRTCRYCGAFVPVPVDKRCRSCKGKTLYFDLIYSSFIYCGAVESAVSMMKYGKIRHYAEVMGDHLAKDVPECITEGRTVIFPPMRFLDKFKRSFNQAEIMAEKIAVRHGLKIDPGLIRKVKRTEPQASLSYEKRQINLRDAFRLTKSAENGKFVLVDDVCTTFSTINTISKLLKDNGAQSVTAVTFARTSRYFS